MTLEMQCGTTLLEFCGSDVWEGLPGERERNEEECGSKPITIHNCTEERINLAKLYCMEIVRRYKFGEEMPECR